MLGKDTKEEQPVASEETEWMEVVSNRRKRKIPLAAIEYIESRGRKIVLHLKTEEVSFYSKLSEVEGFFSGQDFVRTHQSFMVRIQQIDGLHRTYVEYGKREIPVSRRYYPELRKLLDGKVRPE